MFEHLSKVHICFTVVPVHVKDDSRIQAKRIDCMSDVPNNALTVSNSHEMIDDDDSDNPFSFTKSRILFRADVQSILLIMYVL